MEALGRVELPTNGLGNRCSIHLSYRAINQQFFQFIAAHSAIARVSGTPIHALPR